MRKYLVIPMLLFFGLILPSICYSVNTTYWEQKTSADFSSGRKENLSISNQGEILLSPVLKEIGDTTELYFWALAEDSKENIFIGTGNNGKILKMDKAGKAELFFDSPEISIVSLAIYDNHLYAGTAPDGLIYKIPLNNKDNVETFYRTSGEYVWSLLFDKTGTLYAATGRGGKIYKIEKDGEGDVLYDSKENHIMCILEHNGDIYAGGEGDGIIYKIKKDGTATVLYDSPESEIHTIIAHESGKLYAASVPRGYLEAPISEPRDNNGQEGAPPPPIEGYQGLGSRRSTVYQIDEQGIVTPIWECPESLILTMLFDKDGNIIVGTGSRGKLFKLNPETGDWVELTEIQDSQILSMKKVAPNKILMSSGSLGHLYEYTSEYNEKGTLESDIYDAKYTSEWGKLAWDGIAPAGTKLSFETRVGLSEKPDDLWSEWTPVPADGNIANDPSRFIQWKAALETKNTEITPTLKSVKIAGLPINLPPKVKAVSVYTSGQLALDANSNNGSTPPPPSKSSDDKDERELGPSLA
ncbi:MAG TPA: WD40 repeat domain-containing protein, partial [Bacteroidetes bacterium]|nr:WD40 repeat domain-containing protein [Bacteroidota bacterium]